MSGKFVESGSNTRSDDGYKRERLLLKKSLDITKNWKSVTHTDGKGRPIDTIDDFRKGPDGGVDWYVNFKTEDEKSASRVQNLYEKKMQE